MNFSVSETLRHFYVESRQQLYTYAVAITGQREAAEDAIHQAFQKLLGRDTLPVDLRPYVFRCVRNAALDAVRRTKIRTDSIFAETPLAEANRPDHLAETPSPQELKKWLDQLSNDERETIVLKIYDAFTFQEIADLRHQPLSTVTSWYRRGLAKLKGLSSRENL